jgi:hypothetical protein
MPDPFADFNTEMPKTPGMYLFACGETDDKPQEIEIIKKRGFLWVDCPDLGITELEAYHNGLTKPKWLKL